MITEASRLDYLNVCKVIYLCCEFADNLGAMVEIWPARGASRHIPYDRYARLMYAFVIEELNLSATGGDIASASQS